MEISAFTDQTLAVVDLETTGLFPRGTDRIIEIALLRVENGDTTTTYETLVNPRRDLGPVGVHGIRGDDVRDAPTFAQIAADILDLVRGSVLVGHNVRFDVGFLSAEFARLGYQLPDLPMLCTMQLSRECAGLSSRALGNCCADLGIGIIPDHSARADAEATLALMRRCLEWEGRGTSPGKLMGWIGPSSPPTLPSEPTLAGGGRCLPRAMAREAARSERGYLSRLVCQLPSAASLAGVPTGVADAYLEVLDRALEDRRISIPEAEALQGLALDLQLSSEAVESLHARYLDDLVAAAVLDGVVTTAEQRDLLRVGSLLGFDDGDVTSRVADAELYGLEGESRRIAGAERRDQLQGKTVCFTGEMESTIHGRSVSRDRAESLARAAGLVVQPSVTKGLDLLVLADPDSQSGKARKAADYGVRIVAESVFWSWLGLA